MKLVVGAFRAQLSDVNKLGECIERCIGRLFTNIYYFKINF